jgi:hypothetical protein
MIPVIYPNYYPYQTSYNKRDNVATIVTIKVGTFSSTWKGSGTLYFDPGDGGPIEPLVLTAGGVTWNHAYPSPGSKTIKITGDLDGVTFINAQSQSIQSVLNIFRHIVNCSYFNFNFNTTNENMVLMSYVLPSVLSLNASTMGLFGDISILSILNSSCENISLGLNNLSCDSVFSAPALTGTTFSFKNSFFDSNSVGNCIISFANGGMHDCSLYVDGTNPAPPDTQEVIDAISTLAGNGVILYVST